MITPEKIDEWIREVEERPSSASLIIRFIGNRLIDLTKWNDELQAENLALRTGNKVEEYEERITNLEYQNSLLKRQVSGIVDLSEQHAAATPSLGVESQNLNVLMYNTQGQVLRIVRSPSSIMTGETFGQYLGDVNPNNLPLRLQAVPEQEELLFVFDSGRTVTMPAASIPSIEDDQIDWSRAYLLTPLGTEELAFIYPVARMALYEYCIQVSRKGCVKKIKESLFETYLSKRYIGTGVKASPDKTCELVFSRQNDRLILVSKEGYLTCLEIDPLPTTIEEVIRLSVTDHIIGAFPTWDEKMDESLLFVTQTGKVIQRKPDWLDTAASYKTRGQSIFSQERRDAGTRLVGAAQAKNDDWGIALRSDGQFVIYKVEELIGSGNLLRQEPNISILSFVIYRSG